MIPDAPMTRERPVGVVLAGGASSRMGRDKATIELDGLTLVERAARALGGCCAEVLVAAGGRQLRGEGAATVEDGPGRGPAAGILGAAAARPGRSLLVLACDLPLVPVSLLGHLAAAGADHALVLPGRGGRLEPLCALYRPRALAALTGEVAAGRMAPHRLAAREDLDVLVLDDEVLGAFGDPATMFANLNRPADLATVERLSSR